MRMQAVVAQLMVQSPCTLAQWVLPPANGAQRQTSGAGTHIVRRGGGWMNTTLARLQQLNPAVPDATLCRLADALNRADADGWLMLCDYFNITREAALEVANDVAQKGMNVYERID